MPGSYKTINFNIRPAKNIERKLFIEAYRRLAHIDDLGNYRYIGFPSPFYTDFVMVHRFLGIQDMIGIEEVEKDQARFEFNKPYNCIDLKFGHSNDVLPEIPLDDKKTIAWLDYDSILSSSILVDIHTFFSTAIPGSIFILTLDAEPDELGEPSKHRRLEQLKRNVGEDKVPADIREADLPKWGTGKTYQRIIANEIQEIVATRNGVLQEEERISYKQLFNILYKDSSRMVSTGGIIYDAAISDSIDECNFENLKFIRSGGDPYIIDIPNLTLREMRLIDSYLPVLLEEDLNELPINSEDINKYADLYRWFPAFVEAEL